MRFLPHDHEIEPINRARQLQRAEHKIGDMVNRKWSADFETPAASAGSNQQTAYRKDQPCGNEHSIRSKINHNDTKDTTKSPSCSSYRRGDITLRLAETLL